MARRTRSNFLARRSLPRFLLKIKSQQASDWPPHLSGAWDILKSELDLPDREALAIILKSVGAAHDCVCAENQQVSDCIEAQTHTGIRNACHRIYKCIKRGPAVLRQGLNQAILPLIQNSVIDLEVVESILELAKKNFEVGEEELQKSS